MYSVITTYSVFSSPVKSNLIFFQCDLSNYWGPRAGDLVMLPDTNLQHNLLMERSSGSELRNNIKFYVGKRNSLTINGG